MAERTRRSVVVLGGPSAGKTVYGGQLISRLRWGNDPRLRIRHAPESLRAFGDVVDRLADGLLPEHTSFDTYNETELPLALPGDVPLDVAWPDYGGEQLDAILRDRSLGKSWESRVAGSDGWLFFLRPGRLRPLEDTIERKHIPGPAAASTTSPIPVARSEQSSLVELLQMLLHVRRASLIRPLTVPALAVLLSAWDELPGTGDNLMPVDVLRRHAPLLHDFIISNWREQARVIVGMSSLGKALDQHHRDDAFAIGGPETQGYVVLPDGRRDADLTLPVAMLVERMG
jgi:hypothetical protein